MAQLLEVLEEEITSAMFWKFAEPFCAPLRLQAPWWTASPPGRSCRPPALEKEGQYWPSLPGRGQGPRGPARTAAACGDGLRPVADARPGEHTLVWVMFPAEIADGPAYAALMAEVLRHDCPFPWCHRHCNPASRRRGGPPSGTGPWRRRVGRGTTDLSPPALEKAIADEAADESLPLDDACQAC